MHVRIGIRVARIASMIYLTGWGAAFVVIFVVGAAENLDTFDPDSWRAICGWSLGSLVIGHLLVNVNVVTASCQPSGPMVWLRWLVCRLWRGAPHRADDPAPARRGGGAYGGADATG
jgi:hypothetical protein